MSQLPINARAPDGPRGSFRCGLEDQYAEVPRVPAAEFDAANDGLTGGRGVNGHVLYVDGGLSTSV